MAAAKDRLVRNRSSLVTENVMKNLLILGLLCVVGCATAKAAPVPGESSAAIALAYASIGAPDQPQPGPGPAPSAKCDGSGKIRMPDGNTADCPGCDNCRRKNGNVETIDLIQPASYTRITRLTKQQCADGSCTVDTAADCECTKATGSCVCGDTTAIISAGDCASGSCGASGSGPVRKLVAARPVRRAVGAISERRPVRRLFGRLFGRR